MLSEIGVKAFLISFRDNGVSQQVIADALRDILDTDIASRVMSFEKKLRSIANREHAEMMVSLFSESIDDATDLSGRPFVRSKTVREF